MSGKTIGTIIGGAVGFIVAGPAGIQYGMAIGSMAGGLLMPDQIGIQDQTGPRLQNLKTTTSSYGSPIANVYGAYRIGGNLIWANDIKEVKHIEEVEVGKGGSETYDVITYSYSIDMAIGLCEGPVSNINKIWADSVLIYDINQGGFADGYYNSEESSGGISIYLGTSTQTPNWLLQANNPDSPAYRNLCYLVFDTFQLEKYGNRIPNITCEVIKSDSKTVATLPPIVAPAHWHVFSSILGINGTTLNTLAARYDNYYINMYTNHYTYDVSISKYMGIVNRYNISQVTCNEGTDEEFICSMDHRQIMKGISLDGYTYIGVLTEASENRTAIYIRSNIIDDCCLPYSPVFFFDSINTGLYKNYCSFFAISSSSIYILDNVGKKLYYINSNSVENSIDTYYDETSGTEIAYFDNIIYVESFTMDNIIINKYALDLIHIEEIIIPRDNVDIYGNSEFLTGCFTVDYNGIHIIKGYRYIKLNFDYEIIRDIALISVISHTADKYFKDGIMYELSNGDISILVPESEWLDSIIYRQYVDYSDSDGELLSSIVEDLLLKSNIEQAEFDLSEGDEIIVQGFVVINQMNARSAISTLQSIYLFDLIEEDFKIKLKLRGRDPTNSISNFILDDNKENFSISKIIDTELPKKITVSYSNKYADYQTSSQSTIRIEGNSDNNVSLELPIVFTDNEAKQLVEKLMYSTWYGKLSIIFKIPYTDTLKVSDVITITNNKITYIVRIIGITLAINNILEITSINENSSSYESTAIGQDTSEGFISSFPKPQGPTLLEVNNSPTLNNSLINSQGVYYSASGYVDEWKGCEVFKSTDNELTYGSVGTVLNLNAIGVSIVALSDGPTTIWDLNTTIEIELHTGTLNSISSESVLSGENYILLGSEVIQFTIATDNLDGTYTLSELLRGRRGTEWATGTHIVGETFVLLDSQNIQFVFSTINTERWYKAVTFGKYLSDADTIINTYNGTNLKPLSISNLTQDLYETNDDFILEWTRRDRYISGYFNTLPMSEETKSYKIYFYTNAMVLIRTEENILSESFTYTSAMRLTDGLFGTQDDSFKYEIIQISAAIGDGYTYTNSKKSERILVAYEDSFTGIDNDPPAFEFYSEYLVDNVNAHSLTIQNNKLRLYSNISSVGRYGIELDNQIISDFDIEFDYSAIAVGSHTGIRLVIGDVYLFAKTVYGELFYYDYDTSTEVKISGAGTASGSLRIYNIDGIITYCYRALPTDEWTEISTKVYNYDPTGQYPRIVNSINYKFNITIQYDIDNLKVVI